MIHLDEERNFNSARDLNEWLVNSKRVNEIVLGTAASVLFSRGFITSSTLMGITFETLKYQGLGDPVAMELSNKLKERSLQPQPRDIHAESNSATWDMHAKDKQVDQNQPEHHDNVVMELKEHQKHIEVVITDLKEQQKNVELVVMELKVLMQDLDAKFQVVDQKQQQFLEDVFLRLKRNQNHNEDVTREWKGVMQNADGMLQLEEMTQQEHNDELHMELQQDQKDMIWQMLETINQKQPKNKNMNSRTQKRLNEALVTGLTVLVQINDAKVEKMNTIQRQRNHDVVMELIRLKTCMNVNFETLGRKLQESNQLLNSSDGKNVVE